MFGEPTDAGCGLAQRIHTATEYSGQIRLNADLSLPRGLLGKSGEDPFQVDCAYAIGAMHQHA